MQKLELHPGEQILKQGDVSTMKGAMAQFGKGTLTNQRFIRQSQGSVLSASFGLLGMLIGRLMGGKIDMEIALPTITTLARGKYGLNKNVLVIGTADGQSYTIMVKFDPWFTAFRDALQTYVSATLVESGEQQWSVQQVSVTR